MRAQARAGPRVARRGSSQWGWWLEGWFFSDNKTIPSTWLQYPTSPARARDSGRGAVLRPGSYRYTGRKALFQLSRNSCTRQESSPLFDGSGRLQADDTDSLDTAFSNIGRSRRTTCYVFPQRWNNYLFDGRTEAELDVLPRSSRAKLHCRRGITVSLSYAIQAGLGLVGNEDGSKVIERMGRLRVRNRKYFTIESDAPEDGSAGRNFSLLAEVFSGNRRIGVFYGMTWKNVEDERIIIILATYFIWLSRFMSFCRRSQALRAGYFSFGIMRSIFFGETLLENHGSI